MLVLSLNIGLILIIVKRVEATQFMCTFLFFQIGPRTLIFSADNVDVSGGMTKRSCHRWEALSQILTLFTWSDCFLIIL